jgi:hypothetical protein
VGIQDYAKGGEMSMDHDEMIAVIQAHKEGKEIQFRCVDDFDKTWTSYSESSPSWNFSEFEYRIKPEPRKPMVIYVNEFTFGFSLIHHISELSALAEKISDGTRIGIRKFIEVIEDQP